MKNKIGVCTLYTGYNFGSALQAFAMKEILKDNGYESNIIKLSGSLIKGRDIRLKKLVISMVRILFYSKNKKKVIKSFKQNDKNNINLDVIRSFDEFYNQRLKPVFLKYNKLKKIAFTNEYFKFVCGSDQIWNSTAFYVDPFYYLRFAPKNKRIAYAPSFGREFIPMYNQNKIVKYVNEFNHLSIREDSGKNIIKELLNIDVPVCLDPTLLLDKKKWTNIFLLDNRSKGENYIFCYFLNKPNQKAKNLIEYLSKKYNLNVYFINKDFDDYHIIYGGPIEFLNYIKNAKFVVTDSFHGVAFSINFNKQFYVFERNYITESQSTRILSLLKKIKLENVYESDKEIDNYNYDKINQIISVEREKSLNYLIHSISEENIDESK